MTIGQAKLIRLLKQRNFFQLHTANNISKSKMNGIIIKLVLKNEPFCVVNSCQIDKLRCIRNCLNTSISIRSSAIPNVAIIMAIIRCQQAERIKKLKGKSKIK